MSNISEKFDVYQKVRPCRDRLVVLYGTVLVLQLSLANAVVYDMEFWLDRVSYP